MEQIGRFEVVGELGSGGMGRVYRARDPKLGRDVAVKVLREGTAVSPAQIERFEREARALAALSHPNVVMVFDVGDQDGLLYIAAELVDGETLQSQLERGAMPWRKAVKLASQLASGLAAAHSAKVVHRDLKPENVVITDDGTAKILDFGLARVAPTPDPVDSTLTESGAVMGTAGYMAPEQVRGRGADHRADLFALGAVLYEMLAGVRAFPGDSHAERAVAILHDEPAGLPARVPAPVAALARRCLEKDPADRFESARDLAFALDAVAATGPAEPAPPETGRGFRGWGWSVAGVAVALAAALVIRDATGDRRLLEAARAEQPGGAAVSFEPLTFRRGTVEGARFAPDRETVLYTARWEGDPPAVHATIPGQPDGRRLYDDTALLAVSDDRELALRLEDGTLARAALGGSAAPRPVRASVEEADWIPGTDDLAIIARAGTKWVAEFPIGSRVLESDEPLQSPRVSGDGRRLALIALDDSLPTATAATEAGARAPRR